MHNTRNAILVALTVAVGCGIVGVWLMLRPAPKDLAPPAFESVSQPEPTQPADGVPPAPTPAVPPTAGQTPAPASGSPDVESAPTKPEPARATARATNVAAQSGRSVRPGKEPLKDPLAREALALVGLDPGAEEYWYEAINDPSLSANERQDLIEDLNEDGLSDPKHPVAEDLPMILRRMQLIEVSFPYAMDQVNADAFLEAYKDLVNLANLTLGGGEPVR